MNKIIASVFILLPSFALAHDAVMQQGFLSGFYHYVISAHHMASAITLMVTAVSLLTCGYRSRLKKISVNRP